MEGSRAAKSIAPFVLLGLGQILIFFNDPRHFFIADSLHWMAHRHRSIGEFLSGFVQLDPAFWYRPLAQRAVESLLFPLAGLNAVPYRIVGFVLFYLCTIAVFVLAESLTRSRRIAWFPVLVFAPHVIHTFPTYDVSFTPELSFTLFCLISAIFYVRYLRMGTRNELIASVVFFVAALFCKEMAAGLPLALLAIRLALPGKGRTLWSLAPHVIILGLYLSFVIGYLHVGNLDVARMIRGESIPSADYEFGVGLHILDNTRNSLAWAFAMPRGVNGYWNFEGHWMLPTLAILRVLACVGAVCVFFTSHRRFLILGAAWSLATALPAIPLVDHFLPYYLFASLFGFALAMGTTLDWLHDQTLRFLRSRAIALPAAFLTLWTVISASTANRLAYDHPLLGAAARVSEKTVHDIRALHPRIAGNTRLLLFNEDVPFAARDQNGVLLQLAYNDASLVTEYVTEGFKTSVDELNAGGVLAFKWIDGGFVDITSFVCQWPALLEAHAPHANYHVDVWAPETGGASHTLQFRELRSSSAMILVSRNGKVLPPIEIVLDERGQATFNIPDADPAAYTLVAVRRTDESTWVPISRPIRVP